MHRAYLRALFALSLAVGAGFSLVYAVHACGVPTSVQTVDPPSFYDDTADYARDVRPMRNLVMRLNASTDKGDWTCALSQLRTWANADALMGRISGYQGQYERSWAGTDFVMVLLRMPNDIRRRSQMQLDAIAPWLERIAIAARNAETISHLYNNLVYRTGLNLIAIDVAADNNDLIDSEPLRVREGIHDIGPDGALAREVRRGDRALYYHTFALIPLVFAAELIQRRHIDLYREDNHAINRLAGLVIDAVVDPASFEKITPIRQALFPRTLQDKLCWMGPYYVHARDPKLPMLVAPRRPFSEQRLGSNVTAVQSAELPGH